VYALDETKACSPKCSFFKCGENALVYRQNDVWCRVTEDACDVANCQYTMCRKRRLLPGGICGETIKRKTTEKPIEEVSGPTVKLRGKAMRKIGEKEIF
jgi:hypothetical protein